MKRRLLLDTNIILDVLLKRHPHLIASAAVVAAIEQGKAEGLLAPHAVTTIHYLAAQKLGESDTRELLRTLLTIFDVAPIDGRILQHSLQTTMGDFEDSVTATAARSSGCDMIVTRDPKGFRRSPVPAYHPDAILPLYR
jgi:predicted nucleic acid-binding protein